MLLYSLNKHSTVSWLAVTLSFVSSTALKPNKRDIILVDINVVQDQINQVNAISDVNSFGFCILCIEN